MKVLERKKTMKTTVLLFHADWPASRVNRALAGGLAKDIQIRNMYALYPDFKINVQAEQQVLTSNDRIVFQFPINWYGGPALLKQWEYDVLTYGWAYGPKGTALHGKEMLLAASPGADNYGRDKFVKYTVHELLRPYQATSRLIGMKFIKPFLTVGATTISDEELQAQVKKYNDYLHQEQLPALGDFE